MTSLHEPDLATRRQVEALAAYGIPEDDIAMVIDIDPDSLRRHYRQELATGHIKANSKVAENLFRKATGDGREAVTAAIFWLKTRARWKETVVHEADVTHRYVVRLPRPEELASDWLRQYRPEEPRTSHALTHVTAG